MYFRIRGALSDAGLSSGTRTRGLYAAAARRSRGPLRLLYRTAS